MVQDPQLLPTGFVEVRRSAGGDLIKSAGGAADRQASEKVTAVVNHLTACSALFNGLGDSIAPWTAKKRSKACAEAQAQLEEHKQQLVGLLSDLTSQASSRSSEAANLAQRLSRSEQALKEALEVKRAAEEKLRALEASAAEKVQAKDQALAALEKRAKAAETELAELREGTAKLTRGRENLSAKLKEVTSEYQSTADVAEREIRRLQAELKKSEEARAAALVQANKETADAMAEKVKEQRVLQRRYDSMKSLAESTKEALATAKKQTEEATAAQARASKLAEDRVRQLSEVRVAREALATELDALRHEHGELKTVYFGAGGMEEQVQELWAAAALAEQRPAGSKGTGGGKSEVAKLGGSRIALRTKGGYCLHAKPCGPASATDINRLQPVPYSDAKGLEAVLRGEGLFLCPRCAVEPGFF